MIRRSLVLLLLIFTVNALAWDSPDWSKCKADAETGKGTVWFRENNRMTAFVSVKPGEALPDFKYEIKDGRLLLDTRELFAKNPKSSVTFRLRELPFDASMKLKNVFLELDIAGEQAGLKGKLYFEGNTGTEKKHYWKAQNFVTGDSMKTLHFEQILPNNLNQLTLRCDLEAPGVYLIGGIRFGEVKAAAIDPAQNHITNGNAERGWYNIGTIDARVMAMADDGKIYDGYGKTFSRSIETVIDDKIRHSGRNSFRLSSDEQSNGRFAFNSVPFIPGQPAVYSVWLKAAQPNTSVNIGLYLASGIAYSKKVVIGTEWKKYELAISSWGEKKAGISYYGDVVNGYGAVFKMVTPEVRVEKGTVWIDDAIYQLGPKSIDVPTSSTLTVTAKLNSSKGYYEAGQKIKAEFKLCSESATSVPVKWELLDFYGHKVTEATLGNVDLKPGEEVVKSYELAMPETLRGALNWNFTIGSLAYNFYLGVIDARQPQLERIGINYDSRQNSAMAVAILKDFRFGSVRLWSSFRKLHNHGFRDVQFFKNGGFYVMMCTEFGTAAPTFLAPVDFSIWQEELKTMAAKAKGQIDCYEILNESNIWNGRVPSPDPAKYQDMTPTSNAQTIKAAAEAIHSIDPAVKIAGPASCHTDVTWTANVLALGADKYLDYITEHPYRELPELPDYSDDINSMQNVLKRYRADFPIIASEGGERSVAIPADNQIIEPLREQAAYDVRMMLIGLGNGLKQYHHFSMDMTGFGTGWSMVMNGNPDTDGKPLPAPVMFAIRNAADRLGTGKPAGRVKLGSDYRCYLFDRGDRRVAALWKWNGKPETVTLPSGSVNKCTAFDFMGSSIPADKIELGRFPVYLESKLSAVELEKLIAASATTVSGSPLDAQLEVIGARTFGIKLQNRTGKAISGTLRILTPGVTTGSVDVAFAAIAPESSRTVTFHTQGDIGPVDRPVSVEVNANGFSKKTWGFNLKSVLVPYVSRALAIDGNLSDWPVSSVPVKLTVANAVKLKPWTAAEDRITSDIRIAWDDDYLYLALTTSKADNIQNVVGPSSLWSGDGIQLAFDPLRNAAADLKGYQDDDYEFSVGRFQDKPVVYMHRAAAAIYDSVDKQLGVVPSVKCAIRITNEGTVYELAFPRLLVSPFRLQANSSMRLNIIQNINNGSARIGWLELAPGIGQTPKTPGLFMDIVLVK